MDLTTDEMNELVNILYKAEDLVNEAIVGLSKQAIFGQDVMDKTLLDIGSGIDYLKAVQQELEQGRHRARKDT